MPDVLILIPARMASTRFPGKPLADIAGVPMIVHVLRRAVAAGIGPALVATDSPEVAAAVEKFGGKAIMTRVDHMSGTTGATKHSARFIQGGTRIAAATVKVKRQ